MLVRGLLRAAITQYSTHCILVFVNVTLEAHSAWRELDGHNFGELVDGRLRDAVDGAVAGGIRDARHERAHVHNRALRPVALALRDLHGDRRVGRVRRPTVLLQALRKELRVR